MKFLNTVVLPALLLFFGAWSAVALTWSPGLRNGSTTQVCQGEAAVFVWNFTLAGNQHVTIITYGRQDSGGKLASGPPDNLQVFVLDDRFSFRLEPSGLDIGAVLTLNDVRVADTGLYTLGVNFTQEEDEDVGKRSTAEFSIHSLRLTVMAPPSTSGDSLHAALLPVAVRTGSGVQPTARLSCGTFRDLGHPPVSVMWTTPSGITLGSSGYSEEEGEFTLQVPSPVRGGQYSCYIPDSEPATACLPEGSHLLRDAVVSVKETFSRLRALEEDDEEENRNLMTENEALRKELQHQAARQVRLAKAARQQKKLRRKKLQQKIQVLERELQRQAAKQKDMEEQHISLENRTSDLVNKQSEMESKQNQTDKKQTDLENSQKRAEKKQTDLLNKLSDLVGKVANLERKQADTETNLAFLKNNLTDVEKKQNAQIDLENKLIGLRMKQTGLGNQQAQLMDKQTDLDHKQTDLRNKQADLARIQTELKKTQLDLVNKQLGLESEQTDLRGKQVDLDRRQNDLENAQSALGNKQKALGNEQVDLKAATERLGSTLREHEPWDNRTIHQLEQNITRLRASFETATRRVSFRASGLRKTRVTAQERLIFANIRHNLGNGYNSQTGFFTAPVGGSYLFLFNLLVVTQPDRNVFVYVFVDNSKARLCILTYNSYMDTGSCNAVLRLRAGQKVWAESHRAAKYDPNSLTIDFSGALLQADL